MQGAPLVNRATSGVLKRSAVRRNRKMQSIKVEVYRKSKENSSTGKNPIDSFTIETQMEYNYNTPWVDNPFFNEFKDKVLPKVIYYLNYDGEVDMRGFYRDNLVCHPKAFEVTYNFCVAKGAAPESFVLKSFIQE